MLDDREQSILRDIERHLEQTDRRLVRRGRRETDRRTYWFSVAALIAGVVAAAERHGRWVGVCGELAGVPDAAVQLAELGVKELSMSAGRIPAVKAALRDGARTAR